MRPNRLVTPRSRHVNLAARASPAGPASRAAGPVIECRHEEGRMPRSLLRRLVPGGAAALLMLTAVGGPVIEAKQPPPANSCSLSNGIKHVIYFQFDNTHLSRDVNGVLSDLEQMPHLYNFLQD